LSSADKYFLLEVTDPSHCDLVSSALAFSCATLDLNDALDAFDLREAAVSKEN
jgi:hypothetical protein